MKIIKSILGCISSVCIFSSMMSGMITQSANASTTIYGDVNNDGIVNVGDVVVANSFLCGKKHPSNVNLKYMDVDKNCVLDVNDSKTILQSIIHLVPSLPYSESGSDFNYSNYSLPLDSTRNYVKYDCQSRNQSNYTLSKVNAVSTYSGDEDDREIDSSENAQAIVYLSYRKNNGSYYRGSGFIVNEHIIATCAHCLYSNGSFNTDYTINVYNEAGTSVIATYSPKELHVPADYISQNTTSYNGNYDYGLIYVEEDLSAYGNISLGVVTNDFKTTNQTVWMSGFPSTVSNSYTSSRYYASGEVNTTANNYKIFTNTYISGGDSGGPAYIEYTLNGETFRSAIGINAAHSNENIHPRYSVATRITLPILRFFMNNEHIG